MKIIIFIFMIPTYQIIYIFKFVVWSVSAFDSIIFWISHFITNFQRDR